MEESNCSAITIKLSSHNPGLPGGTRVKKSESERRITAGILLCDPVDCSPPGSSVRGILQARVLEWVASSLSRGSFPDPGIKPGSLALQADALLTEPLGKPGGKASACSARDLASIPGLGTSPGKGDGYSLQYSCLQNPMDRKAWGATVHGVVKCWTQLSD